jgi:hypothetical protein
VPPSDRGGSAMPHNPEPYEDEGFGDGEDEEELGGETTELAESSPAPLAVRVARNLWQPVPLPEPVIAPELPGLPWPERSAEVTRHFALSTERWLSPRGGLREWFRLNVKLAIAFAATAILIVPSVSALLAGAADWTSLAGEVVTNVVDTAAKQPPHIIGVIALVVAIRWLRARRQTSKGGRQKSRDDYDAYG